MGDLKAAPARDQWLIGELGATPPAISAREGCNLISADNAAIF